MKIAALMIVDAASVTRNQNASQANANRVLLPDASRPDPS
jgi:hypothetical protein